MIARPHISSLDLWERHEHRVLAALTLALEKLAEEENIPEDEINLNRRLSQCVLHAVRELDPDGSVYVSPPVWECNNQPDPDDETRGKREDKRPDCLWGYMDHLAEASRSARHYVLECKRLGKPVRPDWVFNQNYINNGVVRFIDESHGYGKSCASGAMVGYIQSMEPDDILAEVNSACVNGAPPHIVMSTCAWKLSGVSRLDHTFERSFYKSPFALRHLWVDLRKRYARVKHNANAPKEKRNV